MEIGGSCVVGWGMPGASGARRVSSRIGLGEDEDRMTRKMSGSLEDFSVDRGG